ncbi:hypothetical protein PMPD1_4453 (plasmid) [Paramixta manurensis]|uniref:Uncharacterized protein n=1 Tax=Paramixta manurensis TaxID=2740817 RepID=A0A6M8UKC2_9GAMM|nr:hypothetical protein PMPD1_4453 [Erwiniaceae bacterium PD-1]
MMNKLTLYVSGFLGLKKLSGKDRKSTAEWGFLFSMIFIVPLLLGLTDSEPVKILLQFIWACFVTRSGFLAQETWKKDKQQR